MRMPPGGNKSRGGSRPCARGRLSLGLGQTTTLNRLMARFFWPGIHKNVRRWCAACRECQLVNPPASPKAPLRPLPLMQVPFERIGMDLIGPLERLA